MSTPINQPHSPMAVRPGPPQPRPYMSNTPQQNPQVVRPGFAPIRPGKSILYTF